MKRASALLLVLLFAACSGGNNTPKNAVSDVDREYDALMKVCRDAVDTYPEIGDWPAVVEAVTYQNDGVMDLLRLAQDYSEAFPSGPLPAGTEEFLESLEEAREAKERDVTMPLEDVREALAKTDRFQPRFAKLAQYDSLAVCYRGTEVVLLWAPLFDAMRRRVRLKVYLGQFQQAENELVTYLQVVQRLDRDSGSHGRGVVLGTTNNLIRELTTGPLDGLANSKEVARELAVLNENSLRTRKLAWQRELAKTLYYTLNSSRAELVEQATREYGDAAEGLRKKRDWLEYRVELAKLFEDYQAPDVLEAKDYRIAAQVAQDFDENISEELARAVHFEHQTQAYRLAWRIVRDGLLEDLQAKPDLMEAMLKDYPGTHAEWRGDELLVGTDPKHDSATRLGQDGFQPLLTLR